MITAQPPAPNIPPPVGQTIQGGVQAAKAAAPLVKQEVKAYVKGFSPRLRHLFFLGYFGAIFLFKFAGMVTVANIFSWEFASKEGFLLTAWFVGGVIGWNLPILDYFVYIYFTHPEEEISKGLKNQLRSGTIFNSLRLIDKNRDSMPHLGFRSALFGAAWVILAFFAVTSSASYFGKGVVMAVGLYLLAEQWDWQLRNPAKLNSQLFWQVKRVVSQEEQKYYLWLMTGLFAVLTLLV